MLTSFRLGTMKIWGEEEVSMMILRVGMPDSHGVFEVVVNSAVDGGRG